MRFLVPLLLLAAAPLAAQTSPATPPPTDPALDPAWKVPEVIAFIGVKPGDRVADVVAGRLTASLARAVGSKGTVFAVETAEIVKVAPKGIEGLRALAAVSPNVVVSADLVATPLPPNLDAVFIRQNYHDLYVKFMGPADVPAFNRNVFKALKPGGVYVILDHAAVAGSGIAAVDTLHRIDVDRVKADVLAAGFRLDAESPILANPADDRTKSVFDPTIRGKTDQFLLRFRKPR